MLWNDVIKEVMKRKANGQKTNLLSDEDSEDAYAKTKENKRNRTRHLAAYGLGEQYGTIYFTKREAECMVLLLKGKTINGVATILKLSPRTVEYYIKNMKTKVGCRTKFELIDLVYASDFIKNAGFQV
ncbi:MAG: LuxR family transcriptional regulator [uncultured bacterium]|nr:MAG: LuxR family transcriptional regulator [uncultured bacterium]